MRTKGHKLIALAVLLLASASCTVQKTEVPDLAGPSEMALSLNVQATPDTVQQDGRSQSLVTVDARGASGQPARGVSLRVHMFVNGQEGDLGTISARTIVTGEDGQARVTYTAPPEGSPDSPGSLITLGFIPIGTNFAAAVMRMVDIHLTPRGVIPPPNRVNAAFSYSPTSVSTFTTVYFDGSRSTDNLIVCGNRCTYDWTFGDGTTSSGQTTTHEYRAAGSYLVRLRVTNQLGQSHTSDPQSINVQASSEPTAQFVFSPASPVAGRPIFFNAEASRAALGSGRRLISYDWDFGSGRTGNGMTTSKQYDTPGTYNVTLTVTDDAFQQGTVTQAVTVAPPTP